MLNEWLVDLDAGEDCKKHLAAMEEHGGNIPMQINGAGWYEELKYFDSPAAE